MEFTNLSQIPDLHIELIGGLEIKIGIAECREGLNWPIVNAEKKGICEEQD